MQIASSLRRTVIYGLSVSKTFSIIFTENILNIKCAFSFSLQNVSEIFLILRTTQQDIIINALRCSRKAPVIFVGF
jgi:Ni2+-binding GTPase involved in maturation of urease and hydrogenase